MPGLLRDNPPDHIIRLGVQIFVNRQLFEEIPFRARLTITVGQFLAQIATATELDVYALQFFRGNELIDNSKTLAEVGVLHGDTVKVLLGWEDI